MYLADLKKLLETFEICVARQVLESILKLSETFGTSSFHLSNFESILGSNIRYAHGTRCSRSRIGLSKASLADPS